MRQYPNGDIVFGMAWVDRPFNAGSLYKMSNNNTLDSIWRKPLPRPYHYIDTAGICKEATTPTNVLFADNGDIICAGYYYDGFGGNLEIFLARVNHEGIIPTVSTENTLNSLIENFTVRVFPNPTTGNLQLIHQNGIPLKSYSISDISGRIVAENANIPNDNTLHLDLPNGVYFLFVNDAEGVVSKHKLVLIK